MSETVLARGVPLLVHEIEDITSMMQASGDFYEAHILDDLARRFPIHRTIVDAGANIGNHSRYWSEFAAFDALYAFEPIPANYDLLVRNVLDDPRVECYNLALSDQVGYLRMEIVRHNMGACAIVPDGEVSIAAVPLDCFGLTDVTLLKIDVEGHERELVAGARRTITASHPAIFVEDKPGRFGEYLAALAIDGYRETAFWEPHNHLWEWA